MARNRRYFCEETFWRAARDRIKPTNDGGEGNSDE